MTEADALAMDRDGGSLRQEALRRCVLPATQRPPPSCVTNRRSHV